MSSRRLPAIHLDRDSPHTLHEQLSDKLRKQILDGRFKSEVPLPSSRELARDLGISRNTVLASYEQLIGEGYLESRLRAGVFVVEDLRTPDPALKPAKILESRKFVPNDVEWKLVYPLPFRPCQPDVSLFPLELWNRIRSRILRQASTKLLCYQSQHALGLPSLRRALASYLMESRDVQCQWDQVGITCGSQQALFLLSQVLLRRGDRVLMEDPGYLGARQAFEHAGAKVQSLYVDELGAIPPSNLKGVKLIYLTPSRQFPTGASMPVGRRLQFLQAAENASCWLIEDDYDSEFRYRRPPLPSMYSLATESRVIYLGTMSKVLFPSLRVGYVVLPEEMIGPFERLRLVVEDHGPLLDQAVLAEFIVSGAFYSHIRRCRKKYGERLEVFLQEMERQNVPLDFPSSDGGMNLTGFYRDGRVSAERTSVRLQEAGFDVPALSRYSQRVSVEGLIFGFTPFAPKVIQATIAKMGAILRGEKGS
jgi:GntR family transcriptional regulator / MocR family aminotransferase